MSAQERKIVSYHEVGHALIAALQKKFRARAEDHDRAPVRWGLLAMSCMCRKKKKVFKHRGGNP